MRTLECVRTYTDNLLVITRGTYDDHLDKVDAILDHLILATLCVNVKNSNFALHEIEHPG